MRRRGKLGLATLLATAMIIVVAAGANHAAHAAPGENDKALAKQAYDRGLEAHKKGDFHRAAEEFAKADTLAPSAVALQAALDAAIDADEPALGSELVERSKREQPAPPGLASSVSAAHLKFRNRAGRVRVKCPGGSTCLAKLDDKPIEPEKTAWATIGQHTVIVQVDGGDAQTKLVDVTADQVVDVAPSTKAGKEPVARSAPAPIESPPAASSASSSSSSSAASTDNPPKNRRELNKLPPVFFYGGLGVTVLLAGASAFFAIDTSNKHSDFKNAGCERANFTACEDLKEEGENAQTLTNVGFIATGVLAIATVVVGIALTDWSKPTFQMNGKNRRPGLTLQF
jgi:hypothetical protein